MNRYISLLFLQPLIAMHNPTARKIDNCFEHKRQHKTIYTLIRNAQKSCDITNTISNQKRKQLDIIKEHVIAIKTNHANELNNRLELLRQRYAYMTEYLSDNSYGQKDAAHQLVQIHTFNLCYVHTSQLIKRIGEITNTLHLLIRENIVEKQKLSEIESCWKTQLLELTGLNQKFLKRIPKVNSENYTFLAKIYSAHNGFFSCLVVQYLLHTKQYEKYFKFSDKLRAKIEAGFKLEDYLNSLKKYAKTRNPLQLTLQDICIRYITEKYNCDSSFKLHANQSIINYNGQVIIMPQELLNRIEEKRKASVKSGYITQELFKTEKLENYWLKGEKEQKKLALHYSTFKNLPNLNKNCRPAIKVANLS